MTARFFSDTETQLSSVERMQFYAHVSRSRAEGLSVDGITCFIPTLAASGGEAPHRRGQPPAA